MTRDELKKLCINILCDNFCCEESDFESISEDCNLSEFGIILGLDSLDKIEFSMDLENNLGILIDDTRDFNTVGDFIDYIETLINE